MTKIYADTDVCRWHLSQLNLEISEEIVAGEPAVFHMPFPYNKIFENKIHHAVSVCPKVAVLVSELHPESVKFIVNHQHPRIEYFICGAIQGYDHSQWMDWFITTREYYRDNTLLTQLTPFSTKPKLFDVLLGWVKPHRTFVYDFINNHQLNDRVIMTYLRDRNTPIDQQGIWPIDLPPDTFNTITRVNYNDHLLSLSQLIPVDIYNQTTYSLVTETNCDNHYSFYTEKIVKPILAERLFIVFSGQYYLRNLRQLGFKTFDGIIDETYDSVEDQQIRFAMICDQIRYLLDTPQEQILDRIKPIVEHNKQLMLTGDFLGQHLKGLQEFLLDRAS